jgi:hypothetical protein
MPQIFLIVIALLLMIVAFPRFGPNGSIGHRAIYRSL